MKALAAKSITAIAEHSCCMTVTESAYTRWAGIGMGDPISTKRASATSRENNSCACCVKVWTVSRVADEVPSDAEFPNSSGDSRRWCVHNADFIEPGNPANRWDRDSNGSDVRRSCARRPVTQRQAGGSPRAALPWCQPVASLAAKPGARRAAARDTGTKEDVEDGERD